MPAKSGRITGVAAGEGGGADIGGSLLSHQPGPHQKGGQETLEPILYFSTCVLHHRFV